jgi:hypothetical protein
LFSCTQYSSPSPRVGEPLGLFSHPFAACIAWPILAIPASIMGPTTVILIASW